MEEEVVCHFDIIKSTTIDVIPIQELSYFKQLICKLFSITPREVFSKKVRCYCKHSNYIRVRDILYCSCDTETYYVIDKDDSSITVINKYPTYYKGNLSGTFYLLSSTFSNSHEQGRAFYINC